MGTPRTILNLIVAALLPILAGLPLAAQQAPVAAPPAAPLPAPSASTMDELFTRLRDAPDGRTAERVEREIWTAWSRSGSASADLLLQRGRAALGKGEFGQAIEHLTALVDHAPDFAEAWNARATAYYRAGQFGPAVADIAHVLELEPRHFAALAGFGAILEETGNKAGALDVYRAALAIHPHLQGVSGAIDRIETDLSGTDL